MNPRERLIDWQNRHKAVDVPEDFATDVMRRIRAELLRPAVEGPRRTTGRAILTLAAGVLLVALCQATAVGLSLLAMTGVAR